MLDSRAVPGVAESRPRYESRVEGLLQDAHTPAGHHSNEARSLTFDADPIVVAQIIIATAAFVWEFGTFWSTLEGTLTKSFMIDTI